MGLFDFLFQKDKPRQNVRPKKVMTNGAEYSFVKIKNSKSIKITIKSPFSVKVTLPYRCSYKTAGEFVQKQKNWIEKELEKARKSLIREDFKTKTNNLLIVTGNVDLPVVKKTGGIIQFIYPAGADFYSKEIQSKAIEALKKALYIEAKEYLPKRIDTLASKFGFKYNKIALKTCKTRWGSCSFANNINLNINLMSLKDEFIDYVLIHELCHTVEKNHGERFWRLVENCMPDARKIQKELKKEKCIV